MKSRKTNQLDDVLIFESCVSAMKDTHKGVTSEKKLTLNRIKNSISERYAEYEDLYGKKQLINISNSTTSPDEKLALIYLFDSKSKGVKKLREDIRKNQDEHLQYVCPNCGLLPSNTVDHYIPKNEHPDFVLLSKNLIWSCGTCNEKKLEYWREEGCSGIINFYTDKIPKFRFLKCEIIISNNKPKAIWELLEDRLTLHPTIIKHYKRLGIINLYNDHSPAKLKERIDETSSFKGIISNEKVKAILIRQYASRIKDFGINEWQASLLRAFITSELYNNYL